MNTFSNKPLAAFSLPPAHRSCPCTKAVCLSSSVPRRTDHCCTFPANAFWTVSHTSSLRQKVQALTYVETFCPVCKGAMFTTVTCLSAGQALALCAAPTDVVLPSVLDASELEAQQKWLAGEIELWLNDEWTKLDVHRALGEATAQVCPPVLIVCRASKALHVSVDMPLQAYGKTRLEGSDEIGEVLLSISSELLTFDFKETFVNAFDVS